ncbi:hypothetical protein EYE40_04770 [Glaciihabitans arcticus]|uniref:Uncharacterized protein n=1 Tax=Glaciihabitans arcticus TaxID=2668039 RepID=A0A4Q9GUC6_9MICO|nr:hypothetical protein [Glaciihabitans arcticus]TBN56767.1 hypothetical protein EYE40_04770 [Glaciihabitans arcticus]
MDDEAMRALAAAYWAEPGGDEWAVVEDYASANSPELPGAIAAMVETVPADTSLSMIGTGPIETLTHGGATGPDVVAVLRATRLSSQVLTEILSGVWPSILAELGMGQHLRGLLSTADLERLLNRTA